MRIANWSLINPIDEIDTG